MPYDFIDAHSSIITARSSIISGSTNEPIVGINHTITGMADGITSVATAGTDVTLGPTTTIKKVDIQAQTDNTGLIAIGNTGVDATESTGTGVILYPGDTFTLEINQLATVFIDSTVSGEGVRFVYFT